VRNILIYENAFKTAQKRSQAIVENNFDYFAVALRGKTLSPDKLASFPGIRRLNNTSSPL
jgi:hypothetical protein